jgi:hypothetical protein
MKSPVDELNRETASSARGRFPIRVRFLSFLSATWCGSVILVLGAVLTANSGRSLSSGDLVRELTAEGLNGFFVFVLGIAFGRFLLRAVPPPLFGWARRRQVAIIAVALCVALGFLILAGLLFASLRPADSNQTGYLGLAAILWATGAVYPLLLRHRRPRAFLDRPFVLFLRRFSTFADRTVIALVLRQAKAGVPVVFLTPTHSRPKDWDPFVVGFAGLKLLHPMRSVPMVLRARDEDWQRAAQELIGRAQTVLVDASEGSAALGIEAEMIEKAGRWPDTVCLRHISPGDESGQGSPAFRNARCISYSKSWTRALPRLALTLPIFFLIAQFVLGSPFISVPVALILYAIFWRPAVSRNAKIELHKVLRAQSQSENERPDSITIIAWIMLVFGVSSLQVGIFSINNPVPETIANIPIPAQVESSRFFADAVISIVSGIFILRGANWARLLYIWWGAFYFVIELLMRPVKATTLTMGACYLIVVFFLLRPRASAYFASHNRVKAS